jgi:7-carboxy-7-deazaguanine synthase
MNNTLPVNEIFETIQGEATFTGTPAVFVRLQGCPVGCSWCDTKHTWENKPEKVIMITGMLMKQADEDTYSEMTVNDLMEVLDQFKARHIVITGGEPCLYDLEELTTRILQHGKSVQIETSGTFPIKCHPQTFVTVSPKIDMAGGLEVQKEAYMRANEIKFPIGKEADFTKLAEQVVPYVSRGTPVWMQPLSQNKKATSLCVKKATEHNMKVSIQTHKFIGVR